MPSQFDLCRRYIAKMNPAISGSGGHNATFKAACKTVEFGLSWDNAWALLNEYNHRCQPTWSERDLRHKLNDAFHKATLNSRYLSPHQAHRPVSVGSYRITTRTPDKRAQRTVWPEFTLPSPSEIETIASVRGLSSEAVKLAADRGLLKVTKNQGYRCWIVTDGARKNAQARRLDGGPLFDAAGSQIKAQTLRGSEAAWAIGVEESRPYQTVLVVEGGPDILAAHHFIWLEGRENDTCVIGMLGASMPISPAIASELLGKRVRIIAHEDVSGLRAAKLWLASLEAAASETDILQFKNLEFSTIEVVKDLNDLASLTIDDGWVSSAPLQVCPKIGAA